MIRGQVIGQLLGHWYGWSLVVGRSGSCDTPRLGLMMYCLWYGLPEGLEDGAPRLKMMVHHDCGLRYAANWMQEGCHRRRCPRSLRWVEAGLGVEVGVAMEAGLRMLVGLVEDVVR